jgi:hypothetical protein
MVGFSDSEKRKMMTGAIKKMSASNDHRIEAKYQDAFQPPPLSHRLSVYCNDGPNDLWILPEMNDSTTDKAIILKVTKALNPQVKLPGNSKEERAAFRDQFKKELPAFIQQELLDWEIPEDLKDGRYGIIAWQHPDLAKAIHQMSDEGRLLEMLGILLDRSRAQEFTLEEMEPEIRARASELSMSQELTKVLWNRQSLGNGMGKLRKTNPERVKIKGQNSKGQTVWVHLPPGYQEGDGEPARKGGISYQR